MLQKDSTVASEIEWNSGGGKSSNSRIGATGGYRFQTRYQCGNDTTPTEDRQLKDKVPLSLNGDVGCGYAVDIKVCD